MRAMTGVGARGGVRPGAGGARSPSRTGGRAPAFASMPMPGRSGLPKPGPSGAPMRGPPLTARELSAALRAVCVLGIAARSRGVCLGSGLERRVLLEGEGERESEWGAERGGEQDDETGRLAASLGGWRLAPVFRVPVSEPPLGGGAQAAAPGRSLVARLAPPPHTARGRRRELARALRHARDSHAGDTRVPGSHARDRKTRDSHVRDSHARDSHARDRSDPGCTALGVALGELSRVAVCWGGADAAGYLLEGIAAAADEISASAWTAAEALEVLDLALAERITPAQPGPGALAHLANRRPAGPHRASLPGRHRRNATGRFGTRAALRTAP